MFWVRACARTPEVEYCIELIAARAREPMSDGFRAQSVSSLSSFFPFQVFLPFLAVPSMSGPFSYGFFPFCFLRIRLFSVSSLIRFWSVVFISGIFPLLLFRAVASMSGFFPVGSLYRFTERVFVFAREVVCAGEFVCVGRVFVFVFASAWDASSSSSSRGNSIRLRWGTRLRVMRFVFVFAREFVCAGAFVCGRCVFVCVFAQESSVQCISISGKCLRSSSSSAGAIFHPPTRPQCLYI